MLLKSEGSLQKYFQIKGNLRLFCFLHVFSLLYVSVNPQDSLLDLVMGLGAPHDKLIISIPATATQFTLTEAEKNTPRSPVSAGPETLTQTQVNMICSVCLAKLNE